MIELYTPSGIGDSYWPLMSVLPNTDEKINLHVPTGSSAVEKRAHFLTYLDNVETVTADGPSYPEIIKTAKQYRSIHPKMIMEANTWLESGKTLASYCPSLPSTNRLNWEIPAAEFRTASAYLSAKKRNLVIYTSSLRNNREHGPKFWADCATALSSKYNLIWIGASYDTDMLAQLPGDFKRLVDQPAGVIISLLRSAHGFISFQSGLSCISVAENIPTFVVYFRRILPVSIAIATQLSLDTPQLYNRAFLDTVTIEAALEWVEGL